MPDRPQDGIDNARFGTIFHDTCELFYKHLCWMNRRKQVLRSDLEPLFPRDHCSETIAAYVNLVFWVDFFHALEYDSLTHEAERDLFLQPYLETPDHPSLVKLVNQLYPEGIQHYFTGVNMIIREVIIRLVVQLLRWDMEHTPFNIYDLEADAFTEITFPTADKEMTLKIGGRIDRMDVMNINGHPTLRVVDYKTGKTKIAPSSIEGIFDGSATNAHGYYLQTFLYSLIMSRQQQLPVCPTLFYVLSATSATQYDPMLKLGKEDITDIREYAEEYLDGLRRVVSSIYDPSLPFTQNESPQKHCQYCDFRRLCGR